MDESTNDSVITKTNVNDFGDVNNLTKYTPDGKSSQCGNSRNVCNSSDDDEAPTERIKKRLHNLSDSETEKENLHNESPLTKSDSESDTNASHVQSKNVSLKSRIVMNGSSSEDETPASVSTLKNVEQQIRMKNKRSKLKQKFEGLLSSRSKNVDPQNLSDKQTSEDERSEQSGEPSDSEMSSIACIKQKIKKSMAVSSICDPDTSDEESDRKKKTGLEKGKKKVQKSTKMIDAKPMRMSAKQAMENRQLIKSESNRMLREKAVSLPYHRPKALTLKEIMSRRKPAVTSDGKVLPIKMNEEQLKQYALQLEQRQKEMMELCKSESEDETAKAESDEELATHAPSDSDKKEIETNASILEPNTEETAANINEAITCTETAKEIPTNINRPDTSCNDDEQNNEVNELINGETSTENIDLVTNDHSAEEKNTDLDSTENICYTAEVKNTDTELGKLDKKEQQEQISRVCSEQDSQLISLHYTEQDSENFKETNVLIDKTDKLVISKPVENCKNDEQNDFSDDDINMEDIDKIIENAEIMKDDYGNTEALMLVRDHLTIKPKLAGAPGMVIDLDGTNSKPKLSGVELLKERFIYFSKLKTTEELEREKEKMVKPGSLHLKLKHELEDKIAEKRSLEWAKRLEEEKKLHEEMDDILYDGEEADDSIEKIKTKMHQKDDKEENLSDYETEEELIENDIEVKDKPINPNPMLDNEAEESDVEENDEETEPKETELDEDILEDDNSEGSSEDEESSESEEDENTSKHKKGRILKAFEDSDDEEDTTKLVEGEPAAKDTIQNELVSIQKNSNDTDDAEVIANSCDIQSSSQDDVIQLAQRHKSVSEDLFASQESATLKGTSDDLLGTQSFSISSAKPSNFLFPSQPYHDPIVNEVTNTFSQSIPGSQLLNTQSSQSQPIGEDVLALCTGKFYDNEFVSMSDERPMDSISQDKHVDDNVIDRSQESDISGDNIRSNTEEKSNVSDESKQDHINETTKANSKKTNEDQNLLKSIIDELDDPEFVQPKQNKFFTGGCQTKSDVNETSHMKKRLIIDSDDEANEINIESNVSKKKKLKKKKLEQRALQISDDEDDDEEGLGLEDVDSVSGIEDDEERFVDYDSEENEIEVKPEKLRKNRKANDFFEQEAELTSEDEWVGSGDEDEHGLDRMEREEGDDEVFNQGKLRKELGQIHMRDVLDQDKREVRLLQELLFEDGDLGGGHRQRKFRWKNEGDEESGTIPDDFTDTQEEEFESEEQWRKQRHEREVFLRQMQKQDEEEGSPNVTVNRTTIIKANLISKSMSTLLMEVNQSKTETVDSPIVTEKKTVKDVPSPKKSFSILQQKYHSSVLNRGSGALARLAALATPLAAADDDVPKTSSLASRKRNFVFAALTPDEDKPKVTIKRKADVNTGTPKLVKKIRLEEKQGILKNSLLDHLNT
ncbi:unnamed protein product [Arctia plantaginis]|uniref:Claspin n=1 Tax=Arctia plantaginis TaxID=874455 RepID=A0A8S1ARE5_ARCPL|nr:unnamed protein product [Arctia plantaginis]CAB3249050.1 unnamed protein product [Arctia plantaginis]